MREFSNAINSRKSACSFAKRTPVPFYELKQEVEPLIWSEISVKLIVGSICLVKAAERLSYPLHIDNFIMC